MHKKPPSLTRRVVQLSLPEVCHERIGKLMEDTGLSRHVVVDLVLRGVSVETALRGIQTQTERDTKAIAAWQDAGG